MQQNPFSTYSDGRIKNNVEEDVIGLTFINLLRPVTYNFDIDKQNELMGLVDSSDYSGKYDLEKIKFSGFIAQEVEAAALKIKYNFSGVKAPKSSRELYGISYAEFVVPLVKATQELSTQVETQQAQIEAQQKQIDELKAMIIAQE
jgi:trimeric autotransporter adhesin